jgi:hypothetical protein
MTNMGNIALAAAAALAASAQPRQETAAERRRRKERTPCPASAAGNRIRGSNRSAKCPNRARLFWSARR